MRLALYIGMNYSAETLTLSRRPHAAAPSTVCIRAAFAAVIGLLIYSVFSVANARTLHSLDAIRTAAEQFIRASASSSNATVIATAGELDPRLQLAECTGDLDVTTLNNAPIAARTTVGVRCRGEAEWVVYLPVKIETETDVLILREPASRLAHISASDVDVQRRRVPGLGNLYLSKHDELQNRHAKRSLPAGTALTVDMLNRDVVVKRGQQVTLVASVGGIDVRASGTALTSGGNADRIRVQNATSLKVVEGVVESSNLVRIGM